ncbi:MAG: FAD/NAD-binding family oxidoreductase [Desulfovibrionaceae bacterium]
MTEEKQTPTWKLAKVAAENEDVTSVFIEAPRDARGKMLERRPGQFATIRVKTGDAWSAPHPFTISCDPDQDQVQFTIKKAGRFTSGLRDLKPGAEIMCQGPFGVFCKDIDTRENIVMIAGGVGITPFLSVLRFFRKNKTHNRVLLFWSNKTVADAFARDELREMTRELDLTVVHVISREEPPTDSGGERIFFEKGRFDRNMLERHGAAPSASFYLCGPPAMQDAVLETLNSCGIDAGNVQREAFKF